MKTAEVEWLANIYDEDHTHAYGIALAPSDGNKIYRETMCGEFKARSPNDLLMKPGTRDRCNVCLTVIAEDWVTASGDKRKRLTFPVYACIVEVPPVELVDGVEEESVSEPEQAEEARPPTAMVTATGIIGRYLDEAVVLLRQRSLNHHNSDLVGRVAGMIRDEHQRLIRKEEDDGKF